MSFVELRGIDGSAVYINAERVEAVSVDDQRTTVYVGERLFWVDETVDDVMLRLGHKVEKREKTK